MRSTIIGALCWVLCIGAHYALAQPDPGAPASVDSNVLPITIDAGLSNPPSFNRPYVSVTVCVPGSTTDCRTIDHVALDTGSTGLRLLSSALASLPLPPQTMNGNIPLGECMGFYGSSVVVGWGPVKLADVQLAGERANSVPIQVVEDPAFPGIPADCAGRGELLNMRQDFGNGVLGVSTLPDDCTLACLQDPNFKEAYYLCASSACQPTVLPPDKRVQHPVAFFPTDNNGVMIRLPSIPSGRAPLVNGELAFGIGTRTNNAIGSATVLTTDSGGYFTTVYKGQAYGLSFIDSNAPATYFLDRGIPTCGSEPPFTYWYCPPATLSLSASIHGISGITKSVDFEVANTIEMVGQDLSNVAYANLAGPGITAQVFTWGLPFFFGKTVFVAIRGKSTPAGPGPYYAF